MKTNISKKFMSMMLCAVMLFAMAVPAFAAEASTETAETSEIVLNEVATASGEVYYGYKWLDPGSYNGDPYFTVSCPLDGTFYATFELEASDTNSNATLYVEYPNGNTRLVPITLNSNNKPVYKLSLYYTGSGTTYKIHYVGYTQTGMRLMCWMYQEKPDDYDDYH